MAGTGLGLISTADIARLAGQSRATVGNWKARNPDFPPERGRSSRGPLYDRAEVTEWLESTGRLSREQAEIAAVRRVSDLLRGHIAAEDSLSLILVLLAVMSSSGGGWRRVRDAPPQALDAAIRSTARSLFPSADELIPRATLPAGPTEEVISALSGLGQPRVALMADALLEQAASAMGKRGGEYLSPPFVRRLVTALAGPAGSYHNPASGIGQLLIEAAAANRGGAAELTGQEINSRIWAMSQLNLSIHDVSAEIALGDVFTHDRYPQLRAERVVAIPPWNQKLPELDRLAGDPRWVWGEPGPNDGNAAWIQHCLYHLADGGRAVLVLPNTALFEGGRSGRIRRRMVKAGLLDAVIALPSGLFAWTPVSCAVLIFTKGGAGVNRGATSVLMVDVRDSPGGRTAGSAPGESVIREITGIYDRWAAGKAPVSEIAAAADYGMLAANDFVIDPGRYVAAPRPAPDLGETLRKRDALLHHLNALIQASRQADERLREILEKGP